MMNHHHPGQPHMPMQPHPNSRRQPDFNPYHHPPPQSPMHPYAGYPHQSYYTHQPPQYPPPRWQQMYQPPYMQHPPPPPLPPSYQPRSPMVVSSTPYAQSMPPITRQSSNPLVPAASNAHSTQSPRPIPQHMMQQLPQPPTLPQSHGPSHVAVASPSLFHKHESPHDSSQAPSSEPAPPQEEAPARRSSIAQNPLNLPPEYKTPFYPSLPWYSVEGGSAAFPRREATRRKRRQALHKPIESVALPARNGSTEQIQTPSAEEPTSGASTVAVPSESETPATSQAPSESEFTQVTLATTPSPAGASSTKVTAPGDQPGARKDTRSAIAVPNIPGLGKPKALPSGADRTETPSIATEDDVAQTVKQVTEEPSTDPVEPEATPTIAPSKPAPKSWADLVRRNAPSATALGIPTFGTSANGFALSKTASLSDALTQYNVEHDIRLSYLVPRGLVNTGNMCYMNSILQVLIFCTPFYNFLDQVRQRTVHSMKSETPLIDAMILFMREFEVLASAETADKLRMRLNAPQLEQYGEPVTPEYVYDAIRKLDRFISMRRGHQQDAEEFLGFLLEGLHDECVAVMQHKAEDFPQEKGDVSPSSIQSPTSADGWLEVGPRQKASITRHAGNQDAPSPITKIFGGHLRSELRVPGLKDSITLEPYKPLQLDIGASHVNNIVDALKGLTRTESLTGDFGGRTNTAKKQVFIDTLPPILILHLKRFRYENNLTGTQKIWKKVGYPLELEIPKDVFPPSKRGGLALKGGLPKYRLVSVVYHHGKSAAGGHYTVDVLREDGREWVRIDDTVIRRIKSEDVAEGGAEEDPKILARALEQHKADQEMQKQRNIFQGLDEADEDGHGEEYRPWSEVNGNVASGHGHHHHKKWSSIATTNGTATPTSTTGKRTPTAATGRKESVRDNKVAYILFYERIQN